LSSWRLGRCTKKRNTIIIVVVLPARTRLSCIVWIINGCPLVLDDKSPCIVFLFFFIFGSLTVIS
jgi:hypothetical protein